MKLAKMFVLLLFVFGNYAVAADDPEIVDIQFRMGYLPVGFDTNDNSQIVAEGYFPSTCYKFAEVKSKINHEQKTIRLFAKAFKYKGTCPRVLVPFDEAVNFGLLKAGTYKVYNGESDSEIFLGDLKVAASTNSEPDDFLYAPVSQAFFSQDDGKSFVTLTGDFPNSCYSMREVVVHVQTNVIVIQPIADKSEENCDERAIPYSNTFEVKGIEEGKYLIHTRSLNGASVNSVVSAH